MDEPFEGMEPLQDLEKLIEDVQRGIDLEGPSGGSPVPAPADQTPPRRSGGNQSPLPPDPKRAETT